MKSFRPDGNPKGFRERMYPVLPSVDLDWVGMPDISVMGLSGRVLDGEKRRSIPKPPKPKKDLSSYNNGFSKKYTVEI